MYKTPNQFCQEKIDIKRNDYFVIALLIGLTLLLFRQYLFTWPTPPIYPNSSLGTDLPREIWPLAFFTKESFLSTRVMPLWRPYLLSGAPLIGHPVAPVLYPPHWLVLVLPIATALNIDLVLHIIWMGLGIYFYLRWHTNTRWEAALFGAVVFCQSPKWIAHISGGHLPMISAIAWWPWIWLAASRYWNTGKLRWATFVGIALAAQILNHGMYAILSLLAIGASTLYVLIRYRGQGLKPLIVGYSIALIVAITLSAGQLFPFLELVSHSSRADITFDEATFGSVSPILLLSVLFPPSLKFPEWFLYPGIGSLALAAYQLAIIRTKRVWTAVIVILLGTTLSLGMYTPFYRLLYDFLPGYSSLRVPARWWIFPLFALSLLSSWGFDEWLSRTKRIDNTIRAILVIIIIFYFIFAVTQVIGFGKIPFDVIPSAIAIIAVLLLLLGISSQPKLILLGLLVVLDLNLTTSKLLRPESETNVTMEDPIISILHLAALNNERSYTPYSGIEASSLAKFELRAADGYDSFILDDYAKLGRLASGCRYSGYAASVPPTVSNPEALEACQRLIPQTQVLALLNVRYLILPVSQDLAGLDPILEYRGLKVFQLSPGFGRAYGVTQGHVTTPGTCIDTLVNMDLSTNVLLEEGIPFDSDGPPPLVTQVEYNAWAETFQVISSHQSMLVRSESWAPGWNAYIDGKLARIFKADCALQGVWLEPGEHSVTFRYVPKGYFVGVWISKFTAIFLIISFFIIRLCRGYKLKFR